MLKRRFTMKRKELAQMYRAHFAKIFFNLSIAALVSTFLITVAPVVIVFLVWFLMIIIGMASLFILFFNADYMNFFNQLTETLNGLGSDAFASVSIALGVVAIVASVLSIVTWATVNGNEQRGRIIGSVAVLCLSVAMIIVISAIRGAAQ